MAGEAVDAPPSPERADARTLPLFPDYARSWVKALEDRFGPCVETQLFGAARPLVEQYLRELEVTPANDIQQERYLVLVAAALAYHSLSFVEGTMKK